MAIDINQQLDPNPDFLQIEVKENNLAQVEAIVGMPTKWFLFATEFEVLRTFVNKLRTDLNIAKGKKIYHATFDTQNTANPVVNVFVNDLGVVTFTRVDVGVFEIYNATLFSTGKIALQLQLSQTDIELVWYYDVLNNKIIFNTTASNGNPIDLPMLSCQCLIEKYD